MEPNWVEVQEACDRAAAELHEAFGRELEVLHTTTDRIALRKDYMLTKKADGCTAAEYARRIGKGNLRAYVASIRKLYGAD